MPKSSSSSWAHAHVLHEAKGDAQEAEHLELLLAKEGFAG